MKRFLISILLTFALLMPLFAAPSAPDKVDVTNVTSTSFTVTWQSDYPDADFYAVEVAAKGQTYTHIVTTPPYESAFTGLTPSGMYFIRVATVKDGFYAWSETITATTLNRVLWPVIKNLR